MARLEFTDLELPDIVNRVQGPQYEQFKGDLLALMFTQRTRVFDNQEGPDGPWEKLKSSQEVVRFKKLPSGEQKRVKTPADAIKSGSVKLLQDDRTLLKSFTIQGAPLQETSIIGDDVFMGSNVEYAAIHNFGGTIKHPGTQNGFGKGIKIKKHNIVMPARQFDHFTTQDIEEIRELANSYLNEPEGAFK